MAQGSEGETDALTKIIVGLGNPGDQYAQNRHNVGYMVVEALARETGARWSTCVLSQACRIEINDCRVLLAKPSTYMNHSGRAVQVLLSALQRNPEDLVLVVDDLNLPFGRIRIRERGAAGGHNGLQSVLATLMTEEIVRLRMGIGEEQMPKNKADFVLSDFPPDRKMELDEMIVKAGNAVKSILSNGVAKTMGIFNA
jgi:PTH1 family peptidyl-tRNA hydrolase